MGRENPVSLEAYLASRPSYVPDGIPPHSTYSENHLPKKSVTLDFESGGSQVVEVDSMSDERFNEILANLEKTRKTSKRP